MEIINRESTTSHGEPEECLAPVVPLAGRRRPLKAGALIADKKAAKAARDAPASHTGATSAGDRTDEEQLAGMPHLAVRDDGKIMVSLEDQPRFDEHGREMRTFVVLTDDERDEAVSRFDEIVTSVASIMLAKILRR